MSLTPTPLLPPTWQLEEECLTRWTLRLLLLACASSCRTSKSSSPIFKGMTRLAIHQMKKLPSEVTTPNWNLGFVRTSVSPTAFLQEAMSLAMTGPPLSASPLPRATLAVAPTCEVAASTVVSTEASLAAEAAGSVTPPPAAASSQTSSPVLRSSSAPVQNHLKRILSRIPQMPKSLIRSKIRLVPSLFHVPLIYYDLWPNKS
jgi:hypothetical protein